MGNGHLSCVNKNTDPVFIQKIQRMNPCAAHTSPTLQETREERPQESSWSSSVRGVSQGGVTLSLTSHPSLTLLSSILPTRVTFLPHLATPSAYLYFSPPPLFVVCPPQPASFVGIYIEISRETEDIGEERGREGRGGEGREGRGGEGRGGEGRGGEGRGGEGRGGEGREGK